MNRIIKFRAWDKDEKIYRYLDIDDAMMFELNPEDGCLEFRGEFTGLKDKNGKEIYEGDVLKNTKHKNQLVEVFWEGCVTNMNSVNGSHWISWGGWSFRKINDPMDKELTFAIYDNEIEVIGNIYENKDLLK